MEFSRWKLCNLLFSYIIIIDIFIVVIVISIVVIIILVLCISVIFFFWKRSEKKEFGRFLLTVGLFNATYLLVEKGEHIIRLFF